MRARNLRRSAGCFFNLTCVLLHCDSISKLIWWFEERQNTDRG